MRITRYALLGTILWGCEVPVNGHSTNPDSTSTSALVSASDGTVQPDPDRRGCGEEDTGMDPSWDLLEDPDPSLVMDTGFGNEIWEDELVDTGAVHEVW